MRMPSLTMEGKGGAHMTILHFQSLLFNSEHRFALPLVTISPLTTKRPKSKLTLPKKTHKGHAPNVTQKNTTKFTNVSKKESPMAKDNSSYYGNLPSWLPDCKMFYLDLGANEGETISKLYDPGQFPEGGLISDIHGKFGVQIKKHGEKNFFSKRLCTLSFEPNLKLWPKLKKIVKKYSSRGYKVHFFPFAVTDKNENVTLYTADNWKSRNWGPSIFTSGYKYGKHTVKGISLAEFIKNVLKSKPISIIKMDIEGAEYGVLLDLLVQRLLCHKHIQLISVEFHNPPVYNLKFEKQNSSFAIKNRIRKQKCKATVLKNLDEESSSFRRGKIFD